MDSAAQALGTETPLRSATTDVAAVERDGLLIEAARPVIDQLARDVADTGIAVALTNAGGNVLDIRGTARSLGVRPDGRGAVAPITDPRSGRAVGTLDLICRAADANPLMLPLAARAAREIEQRLVDDPSLRERLTLHRFLQKRRGAKWPFVLVTARRLITNAAADRLVGPHDESVLRDAAERLCDGRERGAITLALTGGTVARAPSRSPTTGQQPGRSFSSCLSSGAAAALATGRARAVGVGEPHRHRAQRRPARRRGPHEPRGRRAPVPFPRTPSTSTCGRFSASWAPDRAFTSPA